MGLRKTADNLLIALNRSGQSVRMEQKTFFSRKYERIMTKYTVKRTNPATGKKEKLLQTYKLAEVVQLLAELFKEKTGG